MESKEPEGDGGEMVKGGSMPGVRRVGERQERKVEVEVEVKKEWVVAIEEELLLC